MDLVCTIVYLQHKPVICMDPEGERGLDPPLENHKAIGFLSTTGLHPLEITKLPSQHSMLGHHWPANGVSLADPLLVVFVSSLPSTTKREVSKLNWTHSDKTFSVRTCDMAILYIVFFLEKSQFWLQLKSF